MNVSELQNRISALRADEAAVQDVLSGLRTSLDNWFTAMHGVQELLASAVGAAPPEKQRKPLISSGGLVTADSLAAPPPEKEKSLLSSPVRPAPEAAPASNAEPVDEDEEKALLETLDEATANAIRVRRRLSGGRKSVRELLAEIQGEAKSPGQSQKKGRRR